MPDSVAFAAQGASASSFWNAYTGTTLPAATVGAQFLNTSGMNGAIMFEIVENNVAGSASVIIEGSFQNTAGLTASSALWYALGYYVIVSAGTTQTTLTRSQGTLAISQNSRYVLQVLDAYPYMRARCTANGSSASLSINVYSLPA
jgi:hypothetical protein